MLGCRCKQALGSDGVLRPFADTAPRCSPPQARNTALASVFIVGLCIGLIVSERVYISRGGHVPKPRFLRTHHDSNAKQLASIQTVSSVSSTSGKSGSAGSSQFDYTGEPRNDLEIYLRSIAPEKEVLVAVANKNVNWDGMLATFCQGVKDSGIKNHLILALDQETKDWADNLGYHAYIMPLEVHKVGGDPSSNSSIGRRRGSQQVKATT